MLAELGQPDVWNEPERAQELGKEKARLEATLEPLEQSLTGLDDAEELLASPLPIYVHAPYLMNPASPNNRVRIPSRKTLAQAEVFD